MTHDQIFLLFFGLPLAVLGMGIRRSTGSGAFLFMLLGALLVSVWALGLDAALQQVDLAPDPPGTAARGLLRGFGPMAWGTGMLGALGAALLRHRGHGSPTP